MHLLPGFIAISTVHGPDSFYSYSCTFLLIQFKTLQHDIVGICPEEGDFSKSETMGAYKMNLRGIVKRHKELIRYLLLINLFFNLKIDSVNIF